jgi:hypothetical protein
MNKEKAYEILSPFWEEYLENMWSTKINIELLKFRERLKNSLTLIYPALRIIGITDEKIKSLYAYLLEVDLPDYSEKEWHMSTLREAIERYFREEENLHQAGF